jgi:hypothetical protein
MKAIYLILVSLFISLVNTNLNAQIVSIPDANFKAYLVGNLAINTNKDAEIQLTEAVNYTEKIDCANKEIEDSLYKMILFHP